MSTFAAPQLLNSARWKNMRIGLLGGSFNPPHEGHVHISLAAMKALKLDMVWWLVTPKNPIKDTNPLPLEERVRLSQDLTNHPKILVSDIEKDLGTTITYDSIRKLKHSFPKTNFVWISGMDNALGLHRWNNWQDLLKEICMIHLTRNPASTLVRSCPLRMYSSGHKHIVINKPSRFPLDSGTTYWMMQSKIMNISSTGIREKWLENQDSSAP